ncbi:AraC family transcriptional regulator [Pseudomonas aeruginosa]|uniref:AraC family transcriptional regulator n=1 Tax=Pseudomonas aeruginosa TaxID=287 RepID=UPI001BC91203
MFRISSGLISQLVNVLKCEGLDTERLCREAGVDRNKLQGTGGFFDSDDLVRLADISAKECGVAHIGLRAYQDFLPGVFQLVGYVMLSSHSLMEGLEYLVKYSELIGNGLIVGMDDEGGGVRIWSVVYQEDKVEASHVLQDIAVSSLLGFLKWVLGGREVLVDEVVFSYEKPLDISEHIRLFGSNVKFGAGRTSIVLDKKVLLEPLSTADEGLLMMHDNFARSQLDRLRRLTYSDSVRKVLLEQLAQGVSDMKSVSVTLKLGERTLQRGLAKEGSNFKILLDEVRNQLAEYYLAHGSLDISKISELLAFKEVSSFHKACRRWFNMSPGVFRANKLKRILPAQN